MSAKKVLIYGGRGGLGTVLVSHFKAKGWWVCSIDLVRTIPIFCSVTYGTLVRPIYLKLNLFSGILNQVQTNPRHEVLGFFERSKFSNNEVSS